MKTGLKDHIVSFVGTCLIAGSILTILAPYGTHAMELTSRAVFWIGLSMAGGLGAALVSYIFHIKHLAPGVIASTLWQSVGSTLLVSLFVVGLNYSRTGRLALLETGIMVFYVWVISVTLCGIGNLIAARQSEPQTDIPAVPERAALYERLKPSLRRADIYALSAEDHYVRVHTSEGDDLILMRLSDAIKEVDILNGLSPHRSWWVAETGVKSIDRHDGKYIITLENDQAVPVSRSRQKDLKAVGWM